jgi:surface antigen Omp85-like protein
VLRLRAFLAFVAVSRGFVALLSAWVFGFMLAARPAAALEISELEARSVERALGPRPDRDDAPEGKSIESVDIVRLPVFDDDDPIPDFVNVFHAQSRERVIRRELLFQPGDPYRAERVAETLRNLQILPQFGVVVVVPLRACDPARVRVVVIVRDVWSLRLSYDIQAGGKSLNYLQLNLSEDNVLGTRTRAGSLFTLQPDRYSLGASGLHPRIAGTKIDAFALGRVFVNRESGKAEGSAVTLSVSRDLLALSDKWGFLVGAGWLIEQTRRYSDGALLQTDQHVPLVYRSSIARGGAQVTRSFGLRLKFNLTWGLELNRRSYRAPQREQDSQAAFDQFVRDELPVSDSRVSPFFMIEHRTARYVATRDVETLSLEESYSLGQIAALKLYPAARSLGSSRNLLGSMAWLGYTWPLGDGLFRVLGNSNIEQADHGRHQASVQAAGRLVSPRLGFMRLIADSALVATYQNYLNRQLILGGGSRPRGYPSARFRDASGAAATAELRTSAVNILSARIGLAAFYDVGGVGEQLPDVKLHQSAGAGVRILFPQLNRQVFRLDWAAPLSPPYRALPGAIYFTFGQAFDMPSAKLPEILSADATFLDLSQ